MPFGVACRRLKDHLGLGVGVALGVGVSVGAGVAVAVALEGSISILAELGSPTQYPMPGNSFTSTLYD